MEMKCSGSEACNGRV